jgi:SET domain
MLRQYQIMCFAMIIGETISSFGLPMTNSYRYLRRGGSAGVCLENSPSRDSLSSLSAKLFTAIMESNMDETTLLNSRIKDLQLQRTYVGESTIVGGGRGLFASCDCRAGDLLTCYPGDALISTNGSGEKDWDLQWGHHVHEKYRTNELRVEQKAWVLQATDGVGMLGLSELDDEAAYLGHFCNDGATSTPKCMEELAPYVLESQDVANASHQDICNCSHMVTVARRAINKGDEIFVSYGPGYWMDHNGFS